MDKVQQLQNDDFEYPIIPLQDFVKDDYIRLWEYFENRADMLKDRLWTIGTWLLGFNSAILAFIVGTKLIVFDKTDFAIPNPSVVLILVLAGCALCFYARLLIKDYGDHIGRNWERANFLEERLPLIQEVIKKAETKENQAGNKKDQSLPPVARILHLFTLGYLGLFLLIAVLALAI